MPEDMGWIPKNPMSALYAPPMTPMQDSLHLARRYALIPHKTRGVEETYIGLREQALAGICFPVRRARFGSHHVERCERRVKLHEADEMILNLFGSLAGETDDIREMRLDPVLAAQTHDLGVLFRFVMPLVDALKDGAVETFDPDEHLEAPGASKKLHELFVMSNLRIALDEESDAQPSLDDRP